MSHFIEIIEILENIGLRTTSGIAEKIETCYSEPHRYYHNLEHVLYCLYSLRSERGKCENPNAVEFAALFHDVIYDSKRNDNEEKSAEFACELINAARKQRVHSQPAIERITIASDFEQSVRELILDTKHKTKPRTIDGQILCDVDLSILGQNENVFDQYDAHIRKEYAWVPEADYRAGRTKVLQSFLDRPTIFWTEHFQKKYEAQARQNLARAIDKLRA